jgi:hypothetical protein
MVSKVVIFKNGHFYDKQTHERFELKEDAELAITTNEYYVAQTTSPGEIPEILKSSERLAIELRKEKLYQNIRDYQKLLCQGTVLHVWMSINQNSNKTSDKADKQNQKYLFRIVLLEDLYVYIKSNWKEGRLWDCACVVMDEPTNHLCYFEEIEGKSLNEVYKNTFVHFFGNNGNPACNAIDRFWLDRDKEESKIRSLMKLS